MPEHVEEVLLTQRPQFAGTVPIAAYCLVGASLLAAGDVWAQDPNTRFRQFYDIDAEDDLVIAGYGMIGVVLADLIIVAARQDGHEDWDYSRGVRISSDFWFPYWSYNQVYPTGHWKKRWATHKTELGPGLVPAFEAEGRYERVRATMGVALGLYEEATGRDSGSESRAFAYRLLNLGAAYSILDYLDVSMRFRAGGISGSVVDKELVGGPSDLHLVSKEERVMDHLLRQTDVMLVRKDTIWTGDENTAYNALGVGYQHLRYGSLVVHYDYDGDNPTPASVRGEATMVNAHMFAFGLWNRSGHQPPSPEEFMIRPQYSGRVGVGGARLTSNSDDPVWTSGFAMSVELDQGLVVHYRGFSLSAGYRGQQTWIEAGNGGPAAAENARGWESHEGSRAFTKFILSGWRVTLSKTAVDLPNW